MGEKVEKQKKDSDKLTKILEGIVELRSDVKHLTQRMDARAQEIKTLESRVEALEVRLAVNDQQTKKNSSWFDYIFKAVVMLFAGYIAARLELK